MRITLISIGKLKAGPERDLCQRYTERFNHTAPQLGFSALQNTEMSESQAPRSQDRKTDEAKAILAALPEGAVIICLDERGKSIGSVDFADFLREKRANNSPALALIIGGADGLDESLRARATLTLSFGKLTLPHQLVRVLVLEQLYRATTILTGHPYHRV